MDRVKELQQYGQSIWLDFISRGLLAKGELKTLIDQGVTGVTSNPSIFQKSICETDEYTDVIISTVRSQSGISIQEIYEKIVIEDIRNAADVLRPVYDSTSGIDGFVSLEVSPHLAYKTPETVNEAQRLWKLVKRPNLMIKVPATREGLPAIEALISQGINVNATLIFSQPQYEAVAHAYIKGLEKNSHPREVASVASFFVSRIDTAVDKLLEKNGNPEALALRGKVAVAYAQIAYQTLREIFYGPLFQPQRERGARVQRMVWGSTGTKNPQYSDVLYVDEIIGPDTTNTVPMSTLKAFMDHGQPRNSLLEGVEEAHKVIEELSKFNIDLIGVTEQLQKDGVQSFIQSFDQLMNSLQGTCDAARSRS